MFRVGDSVRLKVVWDFCYLKNSKTYHVIRLCSNNHIMIKNESGSDGIYSSSCFDNLTEIRRNKVKKLLCLE